MKKNNKELIEILKRRSTVFYSEYTARVFSDKLKIDYSEVLEILKKRHDRFILRYKSCETRIHRQIQNNCIYGQFAGRFPSVTNKY